MHQEKDKRELYPLLCPGHVGDKGQIKKKSKPLETELYQEEKKSSKYNVLFFK